MIDVLDKREAEGRRQEEIEGKGGFLVNFAFTYIL
jgi:hypothetical protein